MPLGFIIASVAVGAFILATHALTVFLKHGSTVFVILGIILHAALFPILFFGGAAFETVVLIMMLSLMAYVTLSFVRYSVLKLREGREEQ